MKTFVLFLFCGISISSYCQTIFPVNFLTHPADAKETYPTNSSVKVRIDNINRFIYKVVGEKTETDFNVTVPAALTGIKMPAFFTTETAAGPTPAPSVVAQNLAAGLTADQRYTEITNNITQIINVRERLNNAILMHNDVVHIGKDCDHDYTTIAASALARVKVYLPNASTTIEIIAPVVEAELLENIRIANVSYAQIEAGVALWETLSLTDFRTNQKNFNATLRGLKGELKDLEEALKAAKTAAQKAKIKADISTKEAEITGVENSIENGKEDFATRKKKLDDKVAHAKELLAEINKFNEEGKLITLVDDIKKINPSNFSYYSETVKLKKDETKFHFTVSAEGQLTCNKPNEDKFDVTVRSEGGVKLDFSTGLFANFGNKEFLGQDFYYKPLNATTATIATHENGRKALFGLGALMHIYRRSPSAFKVGFAVGASTTTNFDVVNLHAGVSFILGDKERFCITPGITLREAKVLDKSYALDTVYDITTLPEEVPTIKKFPVAGFFLSFTYNVSRFNK